MRAGEGEINSGQNDTAIDNFNNDWADGNKA